jgi:pilus assembly protein CpaB
MMRNRVGVVLFLALVSGLMAAYLAFRFLRQPTTQPVQAAEVTTTAVIVAARDLPVGHQLEQQDVRSIEWPAGAMPQGFARDPSEILGRGLIASVKQNEPILFSKIAGQGTGGGLPLAVAPGMRAVAVRVNDVIGVAGWLQNGHRVDVLVTLDQQAQIQDPVTQIILQTLEVLRVGQIVEVDDENQPVNVTVVTLLVDPEQSERLTLAETKGQIRLSLRNPLDLDTVETSAIRAAELVGTRRVATGTGRTVTRPAPAPTIEIISGTEKTRESGNGN